MESEYLRKLLIEYPDVGDRYKLKLKLICGLDPFTISESQLDYTVTGIPPVSTLDIVAYLVLTHSYYTIQQMKALKSLQAYKYFESGFVLKAGTKMFNNFFVLVGKVKHSQKSEKPLRTWCIIASDGSISTAHCTCMAGNSEVCSHVGAILFAAEYANNKKVSISCTDVLATWPMPSTSAKVPVVPIHEMNWGKHQDFESKSNAKPLSSDEVKDMLDIISNLGLTSVMMRVEEPFATKMQEERLKKLPSIFDIYQEIYMSKSHLELMELSKKIILNIDQQTIIDIESATRKQNAVDLWYAQRAGRITASKFKSVCRTSTKKPSLSLIKMVCYPTKITLRTKAISWGLSHEKDAVAKYTKQMETTHKSFIANEVGLLVSEMWPQFGASPDRLVYCECCSGGCLEVKCPYSLITEDIQNIRDYVNIKSSCLVVIDNKITLNRNHSYYFQVQMQIFVSNLRYCDFVIWSPKVFYMERILPDHGFWENESKTALKFHSQIVMPELLGKCFTTNMGATELFAWCICNDIDDGRPMIQCNNDDCERTWFHFECVGLTNTPSTMWYCEICNK